MDGSIVGWLLFNSFLAAMLALDLGVFHRRDHEVKLGEALAWSGVWVGLALLFNAGIYLVRGPGPALEFLAGYLLEKSLSVDNIFVFVLLFAHFGVPAAHQHKVLFWGVIGALAMRAGFIFAGVALIERFHAMVYVFGALLVLTGLKMALAKGEPVDPGRNPAIRLLRRLMPVTDRDEAGRFFVRVAGRLHATPLLVVLVLVEVSDLIFAVDSIPAILAITRDPFLVYASNALAILGLRSLYFALAGLMPLFHHLHHGLSAVLVLVGVKMLLSDVYEVPVGVSLGVIAGVLAVAMLASLPWRAPAHEAAESR